MSLRTRTEDVELGSEAERRRLLRSVALFFAFLRSVLDHLLAADLAEDGEAGLKLWRSVDYALVLTDCHMPVMNGFEMTSRIREEEAGIDKAPIQIIAITANAMEGEAERCVAAGMDGYLAKPVKLAELERKIADHLLP